MKTKIAILIPLFCVYSIVLFSQNTKLETFFETSNYLETPTYDKTIEFCKLLEKSSPWVRYQSFGKSPQGHDLPLLIIDKSSNFDAVKLRKSGKLILLIQACIHPGEPDGKDAGFMLIRDLITKPEMQNLLNQVSILFIPIMNVDGHQRFGQFNRINQNGPKEMGWRTTAQNLNLNRDYIKADSPEIQAWLTLYNQWIPDFFIDCHVTDGADYQYTATYGLEIFGNMQPALTSWTKNIYLKQLDLQMTKDGLPICPYVQFRSWHDPRSGMIGGIAPPMLSQGYTAIQNRPGLLVETHMLKDYKTRVNATYRMLYNSLAILNRESKTLKEIISVADTYVSGKDFRESGINLDFENTKDSIMLDFLGFEYTVEHSDLSGGDWFKYNNTKPVTFKIPYFNQVKASYSIKLPEAYIIPPEKSDVIERLKYHGINYTLLKKDAEISVVTYRFKDVKWSNYPYEGRFKTTSFEMDEVEVKRTYPKGSVLIDMNQRTAQVIAHILEPKSPDSYVSWGFFNEIFQQKEYGESYVLENLARKMLAEDANLKLEFEQKKKNEPEFAQNWWEILNWFYSKSPYWDTHLNMYPVGKIYDANVVKMLK